MMPATLQLSHRSGRNIDRVGLSTVKCMLHSRRCLMQQNVSLSAMMDLRSWHWTHRFDKALTMLLEVITEIYRFLNGHTMLASIVLDAVFMTQGRNLLAFERSIESLGSYFKDCLSSFNWTTMRSWRLCWWTVLHMHG